VLVPLKKKLNLAKASVLIVGNGGAARGAAFAVSDAGAKVSIAGRNLDRARALSKITNATPLTREQAECGQFDAVIHCTPLGMFPNPDDCFFRDKIPGDIVFDMVYNPLETTLIKRAAEMGKKWCPACRCFWNKPRSNSRFGPVRPRPAPSWKDPRSKPCPQSIKLTSWARRN
jgi:shikimate 5-dehydrogenase